MNSHPALIFVTPMGIESNLGDWIKKLESRPEQCKVQLFREDR